MNELIWIDFIILGIVSISALVSFFRGFVREAIALTGWIIASWLSFTYFEDGAVYLATHVSVPSARLALSFIALFVGTLLLTGVIASLADLLVDKTDLKGTDRVLGMVFGAGRGGLIVVLLVMAAGLTPLPQDPWWRQSTLIVHFERLAVTIREALPPEVATHLNFT